MSGFSSPKGKGAVVIVEMESVGATYLVIAKSAHCCAVLPLLTCVTCCGISAGV